MMFGCCVMALDKQTSHFGTNFAFLTPWGSKNQNLKKTRNTMISQQGTKNYDYMMFVCRVMAWTDKPFWDNFCHPQWGV